MTGRLGGAGIGRIAALTGIALLLMSASLASRAAAQEERFPLTFGLGEVRTTLFDGLANQVGTLPNPSGGGFTFTFDPGLGVFIRSSESFGPVFANRAETTGRGKVTLTTSFSRHTFDQVDGVELRNGDLGGFFSPDFNPFDFFRVNFLSIREDVRADVYTIGALVGVTDRLDVGLTVPIIDVSIKERITRTGFRDCFLFADDIFCDRLTQTGDEFVPTRSGSTGLGDIVLRGKYNFWRSADMMGGRAGVSAGLDVKLPTGDKGDRGAFENPAFDCVGPGCQVRESSFPLGEPPRGTGIVRVKPQVIASGSWFGVSPHVTVGAELGTTEGITNDLIYEVGLDYTVFRRVTLSADLLGRHAFGVDRPRFGEVFPGAGGSFPSDRKASADTLTGSFGIKVNPVGTLLVFLNFLVPLNDTGVRDDLTPTFGLEWSY